MNDFNVKEVKYMKIRG